MYEPETSMRLALIPLWVPRDAAYGDHQERLEREYDLDLITSAPTVVYEVVTSDGKHDTSTTPRISQTLRPTKCVSQLSQRSWSQTNTRVRSADFALKNGAFSAI